MLLVFLSKNVLWIVWSVSRMRVISRKNKPFFARAVALFHPCRYYASVLSYLSIVLVDLLIWSELTLIFETLLKLMHVTNTKTKKKHRSLIHRVFTSCYSLTWVGIYSQMLSFICISLDWQNSSASYKIKSNGRIPHSGIAHLCSNIHREVSISWIPYNFVTPICKYKALHCIYTVLYLAELPTSVRYATPRSLSRLSMKPVDQGLLLVAVFSIG